MKKNKKTKRAPSNQDWNQYCITIWDSKHLYCRVISTDSFTNAKKLFDRTNKSTGYTISEWERLDDPRWQIFIIDDNFSVTVTPFNRCNNFITSN